MPLLGGIFAISSRHRPLKKKERRALCPKAFIVALFAPRYIARRKRLRGAPPSRSCRRVSPKAPGSVRRSFFPPVIFRIVRRKIIVSRSWKRQHPLLPGATSMIVASRSGWYRIRMSSMFSLKASWMRLPPESLFRLLARRARGRINHFSNNQKPMANAPFIHCQIGAGMVN
jgi:hypothetical protein